jgi:hypothetical protein
MSGSVRLQRREIHHERGLDGIALAVGMIERGTNNQMGRLTLVRFQLEDFGSVFEACRA